MRSPVSVFHQFNAKPGGAIVKPISLFGFQISFSKEDTGQMIYRADMCAVADKNAVYFSLT